MRAINGHELQGKELTKGLTVHNATRARDNKEPLPRSYYEKSSPQRMYGARLVEFWINVDKRSEDGRIVQEYRRSITASELLY